VIIGMVDSSFLGSDWIGTEASRHGLTVGSTLLAFRFAIASDDRGGTFLDAPPLAQWNREVTFSVPLPAVPPGGGQTPLTDFRLDLNEQASIQVDLDESVSPPVARVTALCKSQDYDGPGVVTGELITLWQAPNTPVLVLTPSALTFAVPKNDSQDEEVIVHNTGTADLVVNIAGSAFPHAFQWQSELNTVITPGAALSVDVTFAPKAVGSVQAVLNIVSNAPDSPHKVHLSGHGLKAQ
jgi:hypothetical protein